MKAGFEFEHSVEFAPERAQEILRGVPAAPGVFALRGADASAEPYLTRTANLRRRLARLLAPPDAVDDAGRPVLSKRLNLRGKVARIEWSATGSEFESNLLLYGATAAEFGPEAARKRLRLHTPAMLRMAVENAFPRVYVTNKLSKRGLAQMVGPFPSRVAAERYCDEALNLFKLRRCHEDLEPSPQHPGCVYGEMNKCLRPCQQACTAEEYAAETAAVWAFLETRGESMLGEIETERERASAAMEFERAAELHAQWQRVKAIAAQAEEIVRPIAKLRAVVVQRTVKGEDGRVDAALFLVHGGRIVGPERFSSFGMRLANASSGSTSLFAQPHMLVAVPLQKGGTAETGAETVEERLQRALAALEAQTDDGQEMAVLGDHLSLLRRWYYRPAKQRVGEIFFPTAEGPFDNVGFPVRRMLNGISRVVTEAVTAEVTPDAATAMLPEEGKPID